MRLIIIDFNIILFLVANLKEIVFESHLESNSKTKSVRAFLNRSVKYP